MKNVRIFDDFLRDTVNINQSRLDRLNASSVAVNDFLAGSAWKAKIKIWYPQGSWAHQTIIKPVGDGAFDADVLAIIDPVPDWDAGDYINHLYDIFKGSDRYRDKVQRFSHCVTLNYANDRMMDIAPCIRDRIFPGTLEVCNRETNEFEVTEPIKFTGWLIESNSNSGSNSFRKVTRLLKYLRDIKGTFTCSSICLTTLLASQISAGDKGSGLFSDTPSALRTLIQRLDTFLAIRPVKPAVANPFTGEDFSDCWDDVQYENFRKCIARYRKWIDGAYQETDFNKSIKKWKKVFGPDFGKGEDLAQARSFSQKIKDALSIRQPSLVKLIEAASGDILDFAKTLGRIPVPIEALDLPYLEDPEWQEADNGKFRTFITATVHRERGAVYGQRIESGEPTRKGQEIKFSLHLPTGMPMDWRNYEIYWRVTNTGGEAVDAGQLRGDIIREYRSAERWESLSYRGIHFVEAFVVRKRDGAMVSRSDPFIVVIA